MEDDLADTWHQAKVLRAKLLSNHRPKLAKGDILARSMVRHDPKLLAKVIIGL